MQRGCCLASGCRARVPRAAPGMRGTARTACRAAGPRGRPAVYYPLSAAMLGHPAACTPAGACVRCTWAGSRDARGAPPEGHATVPLTCVQPRSAGALPQPPLLPPAPLPLGARPTYGCTNEQFEASSRRRGIRHVAPDPVRLLDLVTFCSATKVSFADGVVRCFSPLGGATRTRQPSSPPAHSAFAQLPSR